VVVHHYVYGGDYDCESYAECDSYRNGVDVYDGGPDRYERVLLPGSRIQHADVPDMLSTLNPRQMTDLGAFLNAL